MHAYTITDSTGATKTYNSIAMSNCEFYMLARNQGGIQEWFNWGGISFAYVGKYLDRASARKVYNCLKYYWDNCPSNT